MKMSNDHVNPYTYKEILRFALNDNLLSIGWEGESKVLNLSLLNWESKT